MYKEKGKGNERELPEDFKIQLEAAGVSQKM
jgi:hypothetical protein